MHNDTTTMLYARNALSELFEHWRLLPGAKAWKRAAIKLGILARGKPYGRRYIVSLYNMKYPPGEKCVRALEIALAELDGSSPTLLTANEYRVFGNADQDIAGSYIMGEVVQCSHDGCPVRIAKDHPNRKYCRDHAK